MNRLDRLSSILIQLQSRTRLRAQDIAQRFEIGLRTVYRDIRTLELAGIPIIAEAGKGYSLAKGYKLPPVMFTREEVIALITAEKLLVKLADESSGKSYRLAMDKIRSVLKTSEKEYLENMETNIEVIASRPQRYHPLVIDPLQTIIAAISAKEVLSLTYLPAYEDTPCERDIEPVGVFYLDHFWHLIAWCRLRNDYRDFRFDRMQNLHPKGENYNDKHPPLGQFISKIYPQVPLIPIVIRVQSGAYRYIGEQKYYQGLVEERPQGDWVEMEFFSASISNFSYWFLSFADVAIVISPDSLKEHLLKRIQMMEKNLLFPDR